MTFDSDKLASPASPAPNLECLQQKVQEQSQQLAEYKLSLNLLYETNSSLSHFVEPALLAQRALDLIRKELAVLRGEIFEITASGKLQLLALSGYQESQITRLQEQVELRLQQGLAWTVLQGAEVVILPDVNCSEQWISIPNLDDDICSAAGFPIRVDNKVVAIMSLLSDAPDYFTSIRQLLTALLTPLALALQNARLFHQVQTGQQQLRLLTEKLINAQEEERQRIARELHDEAGQALTALKVSLQSIQENLHHNRPALHHQLTAAIQLTDRTMERVHLLAYDLRPPELDMLGLDIALEGLCEEFEQHTGLKIKYRGVDIPQLAEAIAISFYRFTQEALTNVAKHAAASQVAIHLAHEHEVLSVGVRDNGCGFAAVWPPVAVNGTHGLGLMGMRERFEAIGGTIQLESTPGQGTTITATIPWKGAV